MSGKQPSTDQPAASPADQVSPTDQVSEDWDDIKLDWARTRLGHEAMMLEKIQRQNRIAEIDARNAVTGDLSTDGWPKTDGEGDDMGVSIGNRVNHNHYYHAQPATEPTTATAPPAPASPAETEPPKPDASSAWKKAAAAATLLAAATGGGIGGLGLAEWLNDDVPAAATTPDTWIEYDIQKWVPDSD